MRLRAAILAYGILNAILYAGLLPLWEGFDEPFHYGYVQELSRHAALPILGQTALSREIWDSLDLVPIADGVRKNIRKGITFGEYFRLPPGERAGLRRRVEVLDPHTGSLPSESNNYEAQQAPLAYFLLAPFDGFAPAKPLLWRVLLLRLICALAAVLLTGWGTLSLARQLAVPPPFANAALFVVFSSQMFYAATAHITNDWLAVPIFTLLLAQAVSLYRTPRTRTALAFAAILGAALLTKAYFLAVIPLVLWLAVTRRWYVALGLVIAAPWYVRNLVLYRNLSGMQETGGGAPFRELLRAAIRLPWPKTIWSTAHSALFTGNNSYIAFSASTLTLMLAMLCAAAYFYLRRPIPPAERVVIAGIVLMTLALVYATVVAFWSSQGVASTPAPWYWQVLLPPAILLVIRHRWTTIAILAVWTYAIVATYLAKLIPIYAGLSDGRTHLPDLPQWYAHFPHQTAALFPPAILLTLAGLIAITAPMLAVLLARSLSAATLRQ